MLKADNANLTRQFTLLQEQEGRKMQKEVFIIVLPLLITFGTIGNVLCIFVFQRQKFKKLSIGFHLNAYAIVGLLNLYLAYGKSWLSFIADITPFENYTDWGCRIWEFLYRIVAYSGIWILVSSLVDRYISVCHPSQALRMCHTFMAKLTLVMVFTGICVISVHAMWSYELRDENCVPIEEDLHSLIWRWMSASCYVFIPLLTLFVFSLLIGHEFCTKRRMGRLPKQTGISTELTHAVLALSVIYLLLAIPATAVNIIDNILSEKLLNNQSLMHSLAITRIISNMFSCFNPAILFYVCFIFSKTFRKEFLYGFVKNTCLRKGENAIVSTELRNGNQTTQIHLEESSTEETLL